MVNEYKKIVLVKGLQNMNDYQFSMIKSLLAQDLKLTRKKQDKYNKIQTADVMGKKIPRCYLCQQTNRCIRRHRNI